MMIRFDETLVVSQFLDRIKQRHGDAEKLRAYVKKNPRDVRARQDLEDFEYYADHPELKFEKIQRAVSLIPVRPEALKLFTEQRLKVIDTLRHKQFGSIRQLADYLRRDVRNVHDDLSLFESLGFLDFERGPRNTRIPRLLADSILLTPAE